MARDSKGAKRAEIAAIFESKETMAVSERNSGIQLWAHLNGKMTSRIAFSWTCHPNKNEAYPHNVTAPRNCS